MVMDISFTGTNLLSVLLLFAAGLVFIIKGGDWFVDAATWIAEAFGIPKFIVGATVVSFATTLPEMLVSVFAALEGNADIAVGNAVGSVTANVGLIMCLSLVCMPCLMTRRRSASRRVYCWRQLPCCSHSRATASFPSCRASSFCCFCRVPRREPDCGQARAGHGSLGGSPGADRKTVVQNLFSFVLGAAAIVLGAQLLIDNGSALAQMIGVPDSIIAATMIAIGTSLPELVTTLTAIRKKESSLSVGNIIGANIMDLTLIMPLCALIQGKPMMIERQGMHGLDIPACLVVTAAALVPALVSGRFKRWMGFLIGGLYIAYLVIMFTCFGV